MMEEIGWNRTLLNNKVFAKVFFLNCFNLVIPFRFCLFVGGLVSKSKMILLVGIVLVGVKDI